MSKAEENAKVLQDEFDYIRSYTRTARTGLRGNPVEHIDAVIRCNQLDANCVGTIEDVVICIFDNIVIVRSETDFDTDADEQEYTVKEYHRSEVRQDGETLNTWVDQDEYNDIHYGKD